MNYLNKIDNNFPFHFFTEKAFHAGQVVNYVVNAYCDSIQYSNEEVVSPNFISIQNAYLYTLGLSGRIVKLGEDHIDLFHTQEDNEKIRQLAETFNGDLEKVTTTYIYGDLKPSPSDEARDVFKKDIQTVLDMTHMFYLNASFSFNTLDMMKHKYGSAILSQDVITDTFKNIPIHQVW